MRPRLRFRENLLFALKMALAFSMVAIIISAAYLLDDRPYFSHSRFVQYCSAVMWPVVVTTTTVNVHGGRDPPNYKTLSLSILPANRNRADQHLIHKQLQERNSIYQSRIRNDSFVEDRLPSDMMLVNYLHRSRVSGLKPAPVPMPGSKYIIYLCDDKVYCFGLGDRQRAIASLYLLASVTNRKFGVIMTDPAPFTELYEPNEIQWIVPESELKGKTTTELVLFGKHDFNIRKMDFNQSYPQDVVFFRTNYNMLKVLPGNPHYKTRLPDVPRWHLYPLSWTKLMRPTDYLREPLNYELKNIVTSMTSEFAHHNAFDFIKCDANCKKIKHSSNLDSNGCLEMNETRGLLLKDLTPNYCVVKPPRLQPGLSAESVMALRGHDTADIDLVCLHVRLGKTATFHWEKRSRNKAEDLPVLWNFLRPYVDGGHHVYVATDSQEFRDAATVKFGYRMHVSLQPIVHIARVQEGQNKREGFRLAAMEQLLLSTSCKVLVISNSNLSLKAAMVRAYIHSEKDLYLFSNGRVIYFNPRRLF